MAVDPGALGRADVLDRLHDVAERPRHDRWEALVAEGRADLPRAKLAESHLDAVTILAELDAPIRPDGLWAVWAAEPPGVVLQATPLPAERGATVHLTGTKVFCSGAGIVDHALVTVPTTDGSVLVAVDVAAQRGSTLHVGPDAWSASGMARTATRTITVDDAAATLIGQVGEYTDRTGFWAGACAVAACWHGGTLAAAELVLDRVRRHPEDPLLLRELGRLDTALARDRAALSAAAAALGALPHGPGAPASARRIAEQLRAGVVETATTALETARRCLGPAPLAFDHAAQAVLDDLALYIRQHHGDRDLVALGALALAADPPW